MYRLVLIYLEGAEEEVGDFDTEEYAWNAYDDMRPSLPLEVATAVVRYVGLLPEHV